MPSVMIARGNTAGANAPVWQQYPGGSGVFIDVDTSYAGFPPDSVPTYTTALLGTTGHWDTAGATSLYELPTTPWSRGFRVYVKRPDGRPLSPQEARDSGWFICWVGINLKLS